jgi:predicted TIM-barrel fold metal-dependent hydrolase
MVWYLSTHRIRPEEARPAMIVDVHTHILPAGWPELGDRSPRFERVDDTHARIVVGGRNFRDITDQCWDPARRLTDMHRDGVDRQVLSTVPVLFSYGAPPETALALARYLNDHIAGVVAAHPDRFVGLATTRSRWERPGPARPSGRPACRRRSRRTCSAGTAPGSWALAE